MTSAYYETILAAVAALLSWALIGLYRHAMLASGRLELPNERSMHKVPVPVGAGLGIVATALILWPLWEGGIDRPSHPHAVLLATFAGLAVLSWLDDRHRLSPAVRFGIQTAAVALCLSWLAPDAQLAPAIPQVIERCVLGFAWLWFINLFNFMDGIDGLAGSEAIAIAVGYLALLTFAGLDGPLWRLALILAAAAAGYLLWNWHPAKVFMGDAGSVPLGFLLGWLMLDLTFRGYWAAAIILPGYFWADATVTLVKRLLKRETPWQAHRQHYYQRAVLGGVTPRGVVCRVGTANALLVALALASVARPLLALCGAVLVVGLLLANLESIARRRPLP
jgi:UDP-N-acetylmuramyl pentapeptide phosphotransferase/UDP-N-acetylglucosamine-1-phosphate transferase